MTDAHVSNSLDVTYAQLSMRMMGAPWVPVVCHDADVSGLSILRSAGHPVNGVSIKPRDIS
jgi:hypothetical protein